MSKHKIPADDGLIADWIVSQGSAQGLNPYFWDKQLRIIGLVQAWQDQNTGQACLTPGKNAEYGVTRIAATTEKFQ